MSWKEVEFGYDICQRRAGSPGFQSAFSMRKLNWDNYLLHYPNVEVLPGHLEIHLMLLMLLMHSCLGWSANVNVQAGLGHSPAAPMMLDVLLDKSATSYPMSCFRAEWVG